ncbi:hypothetical protein KIN20_010675 [Parelaphostrongylus tenuis]|uniref:Uncharacterized protein n=1 Tax=Parelaphostrongylus tenuis TaxID=148309 RepID=A0AAD5M9Y5_PARTN|nr:hypothetical protein KIN20_010675 [Parelaphostrongylus tenuis]
MSTILGQLTVNTIDEPLLCPNVILNPDMITVMMEQKCIIVGNTVTGICVSTMNQQGKCTTPPMMATTMPVTNYTSLSGTLMTANIIMASWSKTMWESVLNTAVRMLALGTASHFFSTSASVRGN